MKLSIVQYESGHGYAIQDDRTGELVKAWDTYTRQMETLVFAHKETAMEWMRQNPEAKKASVEPFIGPRTDEEKIVTKRMGTHKVWRRVIGGQVYVFMWNKSRYGHINVTASVIQADGTTRKIHSITFGEEWTNIAMV